MSKINSHTKKRINDKTKKNNDHAMIETNDIKIDKISEDSCHTQIEEIVQHNNIDNKTITIKNLTETLNEILVDDCVQDFKKFVEDVVRKKIDDIVPKLVETIYSKEEMEKVFIETNDKLIKNGDTLPYSIALELLNEILKLLGQPEIDDILKFVVKRNDLNAIDGKDFIKKYSDKFLKIGINSKHHMIYSKATNKTCHYTVLVVKSIVEYNGYYKMVSLRKSIKIDDKFKSIIVYTAKYA